MSDFVMKSIAIALLLGFVGILVWFVPRLDLGLVVAVTMALVIWDFYFHKTS